MLAKISDLMESMPEDARRRSMAFLNDKYGSGKLPKEKKQFTLVEDLELNPDPGWSARDFAEAYELRRENKQIKCLIAVYYLSDYLSDSSGDRPYATKEELEKVMSVTVDHVATFFHEVDWELPADLSNTISQTSKNGWIDSSSMTDLKTAEKGKSLLTDVNAPIYREIFKATRILVSSIPGRPIPSRN